MPRRRTWGVPAPSSARTALVVVRGSRGWVTLVIALVAALVLFVVLAALVLVVFVVLVVFAVLVISVVLAVLVEGGSLGSDVAVKKVA